MSLGSSSHACVASGWVFLSPLRPSWIWKLGRSQAVELILLILEFLRFSLLPLLSLCLPHRLRLLFLSVRRLLCSSFPVFLAAVSLCVSIVCCYRDCVSVLLLFYISILFWFMMGRTPFLFWEP